ncbi:hypothetical protein BDQ17DRAFT_72345 [Cyathus striatus]|nr:hypothetical protein BDQ17DRAFT_72345 [Cyathus striatus]
MTSDLESRTVKPSSDNRRAQHDHIAWTTTYPAIKNFLVFSSFFVPIIAIPYFLARRHISALRLQVQELERRTNAVQSDLSNMKAHTVTVKAECRRDIVQLQKLNNEMRAVCAQIRKESQLATGNSRTDIQKLALEMKRTRSSQNTALWALGSSLADVAAFMHETELTMGLQTQKHDQRGIERLRSLAWKMQNLPQGSQRRVKP